MKIAILFSGRGSNLNAIIEFAKKHKEDLDVSIAITDNPFAAGIQYLNESDIPLCVIKIADSYTKTIFFETLERLLDSHEIDLVVLAGFMTIIPASFCQKWDGKIINIHPSLLPKFPGLNTHKRALDEFSTYHGLTVHFVNNKIDAGLRIVRVYTQIRKDDDENTLSSRILSLENIIYPLTIYNIAKNVISYNKNKETGEAELIFNKKVIKEPIWFSEFDFNLQDKNLVNRRYKILY